MIFIHDQACTVSCVFATQPPSEPGRSTWERRISTAGASICGASLAWGLASRVAHESTCPHGAQARALARERTSQAVQDANDVLKKAVQTVQAIEGFPDFPSGVSTSVRAQLQEQVAECNRALSAFEGSTCNDGVSTTIPLQPQTSIVFELRHLREELEGARLLAPEVSDQAQGSGDGEAGLREDGDDMRGADADVGDADNSA